MTRLVYRVDRQTPPTWFQEPRERRRVHPLAYVLVFVLAVVMVLWVIA